MTSSHKKSADRMVPDGKVVGLAFTSVMVLVVETCFVYWLNHIRFPSRPLAQSAFLVLPPWYQKPRFEVTLLLTMAAAMLFSTLRGLGDLWRQKDQAPSSDRISSLGGASRRRLP